MADQLNGKHIAILLAPVGTERVEFEKPKQAVEDAGAKVTVVGIEKGEGQTMDGDTDKAAKHTIEKAFSEVSASDFDGLVIPGGTVGADKLRADAGAVAFVRSFFEGKKPVGSICHGPWVLAEADVLQGRKVTSYHSIQTDLKNAGANWVDQEVVVDQGLVTSRNPDDLPAFCGKLVEEFAEGKHEQQARSV